jgi:hypothetical protein
MNGILKNNCSTQVFMGVNCRYMSYEVFSKIQKKNFVFAVLGLELLAWVHPEPLYQPFFVKGFF